jgi:MoaD family protein
MIDVKVKIFFSFKAGLDSKGAVEIKVPENTTVKSVIDQLVERFPELEEKMFEKPGKLKRFIQIRLNQKRINRPGGLSAELRQGDEILILPKLGGG